METKKTYILMAKLKVEAYKTPQARIWSKDWTNLAEFNSAKIRDFALSNYTKSHGAFLEFKPVELDVIPDELKP